MEQTRATPIEYDESGAGTDRDQCTVFLKQANLVRVEANIL